MKNIIKAFKSVYVINFKDPLTISIFFLLGFSLCMVDGFYDNNSIYGYYAIFVNVIIFFLHFLKGVVIGIGLLTVLNKWDELEEIDLEEK